VLAIRAFKQDCPPGYVSVLEVEIRSPVKHIVTAGTGMAGGRSKEPEGTCDEGAVEGAALAPSTREAVGLLQVACCRAPAALQPRQPNTRNHAPIQLRDAA
jgi:hypothetical protein